MPSNEDTITLNNELAHKQEQICKLKDKLITHDEVNDKKEQLEIQLNDLKKWIEVTKYKDNRMKSEMKTNLDIQTEKLRKAEDLTCNLRTKNKKLLNENERIIEQLNTIKKNEQKMLNEVDDLKIYQSHIKDELAYAKTDGEDKRNTIKQLTETLKCKEKQLFEIQCELTKFRVTMDRQNEVFKNLKAEVESINTELAATKTREKLMEQKLKLERDTLLSEAEIKCQQFHFLEIEYNDVKRLIDKEKLKTKKLENLIMELKKTNEKKVCDLKTMTQKLKVEIFTKTDNLLCLKSQLEKKQKANECMMSEIEPLKKQLNAHQCLLEKMKHSAENIEKQKKSMCEKLTKDLDSAKCDLQEKINKIKVLERQACELKDKIKELESKKCLGHTTSSNTCASNHPCKSSILSTQVKTCTPSLPCKSNVSSPCISRPSCSATCSTRVSCSAPCSKRPSCSAPSNISRPCSIPCSTAQPLISSTPSSAPRNVTINLSEN